MCVRIVKFAPYFYALLPDSWANKTKEEMLTILQEYCVHLNAHLRKNLRDWDSKKINHSDTLVYDKAVQVEENFITMVYAGKQTSLFAKIFVVHPLLLRPARVAIEFPYGGKELYGYREHEGFLPESFKERGVPEEGFLPYEGDIELIQRFLSDQGLSASTWWRVERPFHVVCGSQISLCNLEVLAPPQSVSNNIPESVKTTFAPYIKAKFDIEVLTSDRFPNPETAPVIQISVRMTFGDPSPTGIPNVFTPMRADEYTRVGSGANITLCLGTVQPRHGFTAICFDTEKELLWAWYEMRTVLDFDDLAGHFSDGFDMWYLLTRAKVLGLWAFRFFGKVPFSGAYSNVDVEQERRAASSKNKKRRRVNKTYKTIVPGVCVWDSLFYATAFVRSATSFSLNALAAQFLDDKQKLDVEYSMIAKMQQTEHGRTQLAEYCDRDVLLVQLLDTKFGASKFMREMADLTFVPRQELLNRASVFRAVSRWIYEAQRFRNDGKRYLLPTRSLRKKRPVKLDKSVKEETTATPEDKKLKIQAAMPGVEIIVAEAKTKAKNVKYKGGTVLLPCSGYYKDLVVVYDFRSLYPALMQAYNICYTTRLPPGEQKAYMKKHNLTEEDVWHAPIHVLRPDKQTTMPIIDMNVMPSFVTSKCMEGILPYIERTLTDQRNAKKKLMGAAYRKLNELVGDDVVTAAQRKQILALAEMYNDQQMCIKIFMNSLYGVMGAEDASIPLRDGARTVTSEARQAIEIARYNAENKFPTLELEIDGSWRKITDYYGQEHSHEVVQKFVKEFNERTPEEGLPFKPEVIYGDSVLGDTPIVVRHNETGVLNVLPIAHLADSYPLIVKGKEYGRSDYSVLTEQGFTQIKSVMRHKTDKAILNTHTMHGIVATTADHSLLRDTGVCVKPGELARGEKLLTVNDRTIFEACSTDLYSCSEETAWFSGVLFQNARIVTDVFWGERLDLNFVGDDEAVARLRTCIPSYFDVFSCYESKSNVNHRRKCRTLPRANSHKMWRFHFTPKLRKNRLNKDPSVNPVYWFERHFLTSINGETLKRVPINILNATSSTQLAFIRGIKENGGTSLNQSLHKDNVFILRGAIAAQGVYVLLAKYWDVISIEREFNASTNESIYRIRIGPFPCGQNTGAVTQIGEAQFNPAHSEYVYDLSTDNQHFCAGVGNLVVHNTDSIFVRYRYFIGDDPDMDDFERVNRSMKYNEYIAAELTKLYSPPMELQFEKACTRTYLITPKKYMLRKFECAGGKIKRVDKESGTCGVRRDGCKLQRMMCAEIKKALLHTSKPEDAILAARQILAYVLSGKATLDEVLMSSTISKPISDYSTPGPAHVELARKQMREGARPFNKGDRVYYIVVGGLKKDSIRDCVRSPKDVLDNEIPYCTNYYGFSVIIKQARILLGVLVDTWTDEQKRAFQDWARIANFTTEGAKEVEAAKKKRKEELNKMVDKVVLHGLPLDSLSNMEQAMIGDTFKEDLEEEDEDEDESEEEGDEPLDMDGAIALDEERTLKRKKPGDDENEIDQSAIAQGNEELNGKAFFGACFKNRKVEGKNAKLAVFKQPKRVGLVGKTKVTKGSLPKSSPLFKFAVVADQCVSCKGTVAKERGLICERCDEENPTLRRQEYHKQLRRVRGLEKEFNARWRKCSDCRGRIHPAEDPEQCDIKNCINYVCTNWGQRTVVTRELKKQTERLSKLGISDMDITE